LDLRLRTILFCAAVGHRFGHKERPNHE